MRMGIGCWQSGDWKAAMLALVPAKQGAAQERVGLKIWSAGGRALSPRRTYQ